MKIFYPSFCVLFLLFFSPLVLSSKDAVEKQEKPSQDYLIPILPDDPTANMEDFYKRNLNINLEHENLARRGEITFFSSLAYLWVYQLIVMDIFFSSQFNDGYQSGKLSSTNFLYSIFSSILIALMITRKDTQFLQVTQYKEQPINFLGKETYYREEVHEWKFAINLMSYDF